MRAAAFLAVLGGVNARHRVLQQVLEFQSLHEIGVPNHGPIRHPRVAEGAIDLREFSHALPQHFTGTEDGGVGLHRALHGVANLGRAMFAVGMAQAVEPRQRGLVGGPGQRLVHVARTQILRRVVRRGAPEDDQVQQAVGTQAVRAVHGNACRLADGHEPRHRRLRVAVSRRHHAAVVVGGNPAHVVMHGGQHRNRRPRHLDAGEDARGLGDAG